jgi:hypothetical protein
MVMTVRQIGVGDRNCSVFCGMVRSHIETHEDWREGPGW